MSSSDAAQPTTDVSFAPTASFARAFGETEAAAQKAKFNAPHPSLRRPIADKDRDADLFVGIAFAAGLTLGVVATVLVMKLC